jgi:outer membrane immunogenic protein
MITAAGFPVGLTAGDAFAVKTTWDASARLRAGYLFNPTLLLYATGGAAWLHVEETSTCGTLPFGVAAWTCGPGQFVGGTTLVPAAISHSDTRLGVDCRWRPRNQALAALGRPS